MPERAYIVVPLVVLAFICFVVGAFLPLTDVRGDSAIARINWTALGLAFLTAGAATWEK